MNVASQLPLACTVSREHCSLRSQQALTRRFSHVSKCFSCIHSDTHRHLHIHTRTWQHLGTPTCSYKDFSCSALRTTDIARKRDFQHSATHGGQLCLCVSSWRQLRLKQKCVCARCSKPYCRTREKANSVPEAFAVQSQMETWRPWSSSP